MAGKLARFSLLLMTLALSVQTRAQEAGGEAVRRYIPMSVEDALMHQASGPEHSRSSTQRLNERLDALKQNSRQSRDYSLGPEDVVEVTVIGVPALERREFALDSQGRISLPYVGEVGLLGKTARQAEAGIARMFGESLLENPEVTLSIKSYKSQLFYIFGAVNKPGANQLSGELRLLDALTLAGGLSESADLHLQIHRNGKMPPQAVPSMAASDPSEWPNLHAAPQDFHTVEVDLADLMDRGNLGLNLSLQPGDVIIVPEMRERFVYVLGDVQKPGAYSLRRNERMTISKAIASAGGVLPTASGSRSKIMRPNPDGITARQIPVNVVAVIKGEAKDIELTENDLVLIPGSATKTLSRGFMGSLTGLLTTLLVIGVR